LLGLNKEKIASSSSTGKRFLVAGTRCRLLEFTGERCAKIEKDRPSTIFKLSLLGLYYELPKFIWSKKIRPKKRG
jgi:hypothetical protein